MSEEDRKGPSKEEQFWLDVAMAGGNYSEELDTSTAMSTFRIAVLALPIVLGSRAPASCFSPIHASLSKFCHSRAD
jgi:hypothetical protein